MSVAALCRRAPGWVLALLLSACQSLPTSGAAAQAGLPAAPPWPAPADARAKISAAGLDALSAEGTAYHIHPHLDVFYQGQRVVVPAFIGIDPNRAFISSLHTHADAGVLHVESDVVKDFTLRQFFTEWGVPLDGAKAYVNGAPVSDPGAVVFADHQEITVVFGSAPASIPTSFEGPWF